jgi:tetratricopeptide (TPR) repeat protein
MRANSLLPIPCRTHGPTGRGAKFAAWCFVLGGLLVAHAIAAEEPFQDPQQLFQAGKYADSIREAAKAIASQPWRESWREIKIRAEMETGQYAAALATLTEALEHSPSSIRLRLLGREVYRFNNRPLDAEKVFAEIGELAQSRTWGYTDSASRVALGRYFLARGADARQVLETFYDRAKEDQPASTEAWLAAADLALEKHDYALAAESLQTAAKISPDDPAVHYRLARAYAESDPQRSQRALARAIELNPRCAASLLLVADGLFDAEQYREARDVLNRALEINPRHPEACAYMALLARLEGDPADEQNWRKKALADWAGNPAVDHLIGRKLSEKYRFAEGAMFQRQALSLDPKYLPAKIQLSQDLLRLGQEDEGWRLADEVYQADGYNVLAHNLTTLHEHLAGFRTLEADGLLVRMDPREAEIYGGRVLDLLRQAKRDLCRKYDTSLDGPVVVELFPEQKDFAIRTLGLPGGQGLLGVCFGSVVTANSPASQGEHAQNWQAVLWHEFCHAVTLHKTANRMPRWLSEGISVYEERQRDPAWGQSMNAVFRKMIVEGGLVPVSRLSGAFLNPPSPVHLQFAYYESSLVVQYLAEKHGLAALKQILTDLGAGVPVNRSLERHAGPLNALDRDFADYAKRQADQFAPQADWSDPRIPLQADLPLISEWVRQHPNNVVGLERLAARLIKEKTWEEAKKSLEELLELNPANYDADGPYLLLAQVHRELGETEAERAVLEKLASRAADAVDAFVRLMEICAEREDWEGLTRNADRLLAVNPLTPLPHRRLAEAAEALGQPAQAIPAYQALLRMEPAEPAEIHFRLARALAATGDRKTAKRQVLMALEEAPRFRDAQRLLLKLVDQPLGSPAEPATSTPATEQRP